MNYFKKLFWCILFAILSSCSAQVEKMNGVSFVASRDVIDESHIDPVVKVNANYAAIMPFGFIKEFIPKLYTIQIANGLAKPELVPSNTLKNSVRRILK